jgi:hypothetical protein
MSTYLEYQRYKARYFPRKKTLYDLPPEAFGRKLAEDLGRAYRQFWRRYWRIEARK